MTVVPAAAGLGGLGAQVAAFGLHDRREAIIGAPLSDQQLGRLLASCRRERTVGLLAAAMADRSFPALDDQVERVYRTHAEAMGAAVLLEQLLVSSSAVVAGSVDHRVLKGSAFAHLDWPDPSWRTFHDVDLLVAGNSDVAVDMLAAVGCTRRTAEVSRGFDHRFGKGTTLLAPSGYEIDIHRTLAAGAYGLLIKRDELFDGAATLRIAGMDIATLGRPQRLVHACYHAALGGSRPRHVTCRDVAELALGAPDEDRAAALVLARSWDGQAVLARGLVLAADLLALPEAHPLIHWARRYEPTPIERRRLQAYAGPERSFARQAFEGWRTLPSLRDRIAYGRHLVFASRDHLVGRNESATGRLLHTARVLARRPGR